MRELIGIVSRKQTELIGIMTALNITYFTLHNTHKNFLKEYIENFIC